MIPGDLVRCSRAYGVLTYPFWGNKSEGYPRQNGLFEPHEIGVVIGTLTCQGEGGVRLLVTGKDPRIVWVHFLDLMKL
jgi:hypothetical protein